MNGKKILSSILACSILLSQSAVAFAADISTGTSDVTLIKTSRVGEDGGDEGPSIVQVKVPSEIPISQDEDGVSTVADNLAVQNLSQDTDIEVTGINVTGKNGWQIIDYSDDISMETEGTKKLGLEFRGDGTTSTGDFDITDGNWDVQADSSIQLNAKAKLPLQGDEYDTKQSIATVTWRVAISADQGSEDGGNEEQPPVEHEGAITNNWDSATKLLPTGSKGVKFSWDSTDEGATITEVKSSDPEVATITPSALNSLAEMPFSGTADYTVTALKKGTTTVTATLSSGEQTQFNVNVYELSNNTGSSGSNEIEITVPGDGFETGDDLSDSDITIEIPVTTPDGGDDVIEIKPEIPDGTELQPGDNEIEVEVEVDGVVIKITIVIRVESSNPSNGLTQTVEDAQAMGFTFSSYEDGLQIDSFENKQFKSEINVPEQIGDFKVLKIGDEVFKDETNLTKITLPDTITVIGTSAFEGCSGLAEVDLSSNLKLVGAYAFRSCTNIKEIKFPSGTTAISASAFEYTPNLEYVNIPESCTSLGSLVSSASSYAGNETSVLDIQSISLVEKDYESRGANRTPFRYWKGTVIIPEGTKKIGDRFLDDSSISRVILPSTVVAIGFYAFNSCNNATINFPDSVQESEGTPFDGVFFVEMSRKQFDKWGMGGAQNVTIDGAKGIELATDNMSLIGLTGEETTLDLTKRFTGTDGNDYYIVGIGENAFKNNNYLETLKIGGTVLSTSEGSFEECQKLKSVTIIDGLGTLGNYSFRNCLSLQEVSLPNSLTWIRNRVFQGCASLADLVIPDSVTTIYSGAFYGVPHVTYHGTAEGSPWGALSIN